MRRYPEYRGMSYEQASREGLWLCQAAAETGSWVGIIDRLAALRDVMTAATQTPYRAA